MKSFTIGAIAAAAMTVAALGLAGPVQADPAAPEPMPAAGTVMDGDDAVMMVNRMMYECMYGGTPGVPRAVLQDRGIQFVCM